MDQAAIFAQLIVAELLQMMKLIQQLNNFSFVYNIVKAVSSYFPLLHILTNLQSSELKDSMSTVQNELQD